MDSCCIFCPEDDARRLPVYVTTVGYWEHQGEMVRPDGFPDYQLHQVLQGKGELTIAGERHIVGPGEAFFLYPRIEHAYVPLTEPWEVAWVSFNGRESGQMLQYAGVVESGPVRMREGSLLPPLEQMITLGMDDVLEASNERAKLLFALLLDLKQVLLAPASQAQERERLKPILQHIEAHLHRPLALNELAGVANVSPQYVCRLFQQVLHVRPTVYMNQQRINRGKHLMVNEPAKKMYEIARMVGFDNVSYFCAVFRRQTGMSPDAFKKMHGLNR
ncbi:helix-turn-helix transcriptional regulator [Paenibacillus sp. MMS18-CY102]|uniref:helix-turn-helix transcriptional regulator n=1 Tax=Paenibacillus sp. MMS18-CY102 TaxID=2682849 RepID=UPI0013666C6A|nr:AraC family transcriptional regulator [Paenibacillus sp. MMS18-CY102]MWC30819.1 helix-turn-helix domain-containing protein [Paenibacillus sp. MMS18-CY102]